MQVKAPSQIAIEIEGLRSKSTGSKDWTVYPPTTQVVTSWLRSIREIMSSKAALT